MSTPETAVCPAFSFPFQSGAAAELVRDHDWSATSLGPLEVWSAELKAVVSLMLGSATPMVLLWGGDGVLIYNDAYAAFAGGRHPSAFGRTAADGWPEVAAFNRHVLDVVLGQGFPLAYKDEHLVLARHGAPEDVWLDLDYSPVFDAQGLRTGVLVLVKETTARVRVEQRLEFAQAAGGVGMFEWYPDNASLAVSDEYRRIWGLPAEGDVTDDMLVDLLHPDDRGLAGTARRHMANPMEYAEYRRLFPETGEVRWIGRRGQVISSPESGARRFVGVAMDVTERKLAELALSELAATLETRVESEIAERRQVEAALHQSRKMETVGKLTGGVAHDFNNLLQIISGNLMLLAKDVVGDPRAERRVANAMAGVDRGAKLASQLLAFGRRQALAPRAMNPGRLIAGMDDMLRRSLGDAIEIETVIAGGLWNASIDTSQIENAVLNLAINARDAMEGHGRLTIELGNTALDDGYARAHPDVTPGQYVVLAITDTGSGMSPEVLDQVFEPFFSTKPEGQGTGLGLSMVYGFVKQSGGHVKIYSEPGLGTSVKLYLPRAFEPEDAADAAASPTRIVGGAETVLVAEDDPGVRDVAVEILSELGYRVLAAPDAVGALGVIDSGAAIDLLFTDVVMPGPLKSPELARLARQRLPGLAVLFTSGYAENAIVHGGRLDPGVHLLGKPYSREALALKVRQVLADQRGRSPTEI